MANRSKRPESVREAVGVFHDAESLEAAIDALLESGFDRAELSLLAGEEAVRARLGHLYDKTTAAEDDPQAPRAAYVARESIGDARGAVLGALMYIPAVAAAGAVLATGGALASAIAGAALLGGSGGMIGIYLGKILEAHHAQYLQKQLDKGGILLWVRTTTPAKERTACAVLKRHAAGDVHIHALPAAGGASPDA